MRANSGLPKPGCQIPQALAEALQAAGSGSVAHQCARVGKARQKTNFTPPPPPRRWMAYSDPVIYLLYDGEQCTRKANRVWEWKKEGRVSSKVLRRQERDEKERQNGSKERKKKKKATT